MKTESEIYRAYIEEKNLVGISDEAEPYIKNTMSFQFYVLLVRLKDMFEDTEK